MTFAKRAVAAVVTLVILVLAAAYLPAPISTAAGIILGGFVLLLLLPLILALIGMVSVFLSDDDDGMFDGIMDAWFMWTVLDWLGLAFRWPWIALKWTFTRLWPDSAEKRKREEAPPFDRET